LKEHTADNGLHIPPAFDAAGNIHPGRIGKGDQMKRIADTEKFLQKTPGHIIVYFPVGAAHAGRRIQEEHQINGLLPQDHKKRAENKNKRKNNSCHSRTCFFFKVLSRRPLYSTTPPPEPLSGSIFSIGHRRYTFYHIRDLFIVD
jgi:hypothetical protein